MRRAAPSGSCGERIDFRQRMPKRFPCPDKVMVGLQVQPEFRFHSEVHPEPRSGISGDRTIASHDRRRQTLRLTARGRAVYARIVPLARPYESTLAAALDRVERREFDRLLGKLMAAARTLGQPEQVGAATRN